MADEQQHLWRARLRKGCAAFGATILVWTIGLGVYSAAVARPLPCGKCGRGYGADATAAQRATTVQAGMAVGCAVLVLGVLALARLRARRRGEDVASGAGVGWTVVALLVWAVAALLYSPVDSRLSLLHVVSLYRRATRDFTITDQLPTALAAVALTVIGCTAVITARATTLRGHRWAAAAGVILAVIVGVAATTAAVRTGDDDRYVDATTTVPQAIPRVPETLGSQRFHLTVAQRLPFSEHAAEFSAYATVFAAGAGFVVWRAAVDAVFAYDAASRERWHYRRTGPGKVRIVAVHIYDQGKTVVLKLGLDSESNDPALVGIDAVTGNRLWSATDATLAEAFDDGGYWTPTPFLVARDTKTWVGFDARTGHKIWQIANPLGCGSGRSADTSTLLADITECIVDQKVTFRLVTVDPGTGHIVGNRAVLDRTRQEVDSVFVHPMGSEGMLLDVARFNTNEGSGLYIDAVTGQTADMRHVRPLRQRPRVGDPLADAGSPDRVILYNADGRPRCDVPGSGWLSTMHAVDQPGIAWLGKQFIYVASEQGEIFLRVADRGNCTTVATLPNPWDTLDLIGAPGVTLVRWLTRDGDVVIDGYAP